MVTIHVDIVSAEKEIFSGEAEMVFAPAILGEVGIAPGHTPLVTQLAPGEVRIKQANGEEEGFYVSGGMLEVQPDVVTVLSDTAMRAEDLDEAAVLKAREEAEHELHDRDANIEYATALAKNATALAKNAEAVALPQPYKSAWSRFGHPKDARRGRPMDGAHQLWLCFRSQAPPGRPNLPGADLDDRRLPSGCASGKAHIKNPA